MWHFALLFVDSGGYMCVLGGDEDDDYESVYRTHAHLLRANSNT